MKMNTWAFLRRMSRDVLPEVHEQLNHWEQQARAIPDPELRRQALASIRTKTFHCEGGSVYAAAAPNARHILIPLIVAFQTISDYLDNLCDRSTSLDADDFFCLHESMLDAVSLQRPLHNYYEVRERNGGPFEDGGYLQNLVLACREKISLLPGYAVAEQQILTWVGLYRDLQVHKHVHPSERESRLLDWWNQHHSRFPGLRWNEFAAASGSTLGVFALFLAACDDALAAEKVERQARAYFPWICSLHILLDYLVDLEEDQLGGDLNFISYYETRQEIVERLAWIAKRAREEAHRLSVRSPIHLIAVDGLLGFYLSDLKVERQSLVQQAAKSLLRLAGWRVWLFYLYSKWYRGGEMQMQMPPSRETGAHGEAKRGDVGCSNEN